MRVSLPLLLVVACELPPPATPPLPLALTVKVAPYPVYGATGAEVRDFIEQKAPVPSPERTGGLHYDAYTSWRIGWSHSEVQAGGRCYVSGAQVTLTVIEVVPQWAPPEGTPAALVARWSAYDAAIRGHEDRHRDIAVAAGHAVVAAVTGLPGAERCEAASAAFDDAARAVLTEYKARQAAFDVETNHGANQGVVFP